MQVGIGEGIEFKIEGGGQAGYSRDTFVGIDDGELICGVEMTLGVSVAGEYVLGDSYTYVSERGGKQTSLEYRADDGPWDMMNYSETTKSGKSCGLFAKNSDGELLFSVGVSKHFIFGGHAKFAFNITEFWERLWD